jgi:small conductance mechanosensitive channel
MRNSTGRGRTAGGSQGAGTRGARRAAPAGPLGARQRARQTDRARRTARTARASPHGRGRRGVGSAAAYQRSAQQRLRRFRQGSLLAVAVTGLFLLLWGIPDEVPAQDTLRAGEVIVIDTVPAGPLAEDLPADPGRAVEEATGTVRDIARELTARLPAILIAAGLLLVAALLVRAVRLVLRLVLRGWERADAATAMAGVIIWLLAIGIALSVVAGDARALVGSVGLLGLALSWALQAPIESFAGWLLNSFKAYYRVGDRIGVGDVFGDVYRIDFLNTTVWEAGGLEKAVQGAQPTGALITFPNSEVLRANVINYTRDFPYVWDEVEIGVTNESDLGYAMRVVADTARRVIGPGMAGPVATYRGLLESEGLGFDIAEEPQVYVSQTESWTVITVRYLVAARERRKWASAMLYELNTEIGKDEHRGRIAVAYPVMRLDLPDAHTRATD